jgi:hypothetical protein
MSSDSNRIARIDRRRFLRAVAMGAATAPWLLPRAAQARLVCKDHAYGRTCRVGLPTRLLHVTAAQARSQWCWAASIAMIFEFYGRPVAQSRIVAECYGTVVDMPASPYMILAALNRSWIDDNGRDFQVESDWGDATLEQVANDLADDHPLIIGTMGHAMVLTAMTYTFPPILTPYGPTFGPPQLQQVIVRDPWPGRGRRELSVDEVVSTLMCARIRVY